MHTAMQGAKRKTRIGMAAAILGLGILGAACGSSTGSVSTNPGSGGNSGSTSNTSSTSNTGSTSNSTTPTTTGSQGGGWG